MRRLQRSRGIIYVLALACLVSACQVKKKGKGLSFSIFEAAPTTAVPAFPTDPNPEAIQVREGGCTVDDACRVGGRCTLQGDRCVVGGDLDCQGSSGCEAGGRCSMRDGRCVVASDADCVRSMGCARGKCIAFENSCIASAASCAKTLACRDFGQCGVRNGTCTVGSDQDCAKSRGCATDGWCVNVFGACARAEREGKPITPPAKGADATRPSSGSE